MEWFRNRTEAKVIIETWWRHYNEDRPHSSLGLRTPKQFREEHQRKKQQLASTHRAILNQSVVLKNRQVRSLRMHLATQ